MLKFQELVESYAPEVFRFALWLSGDSAEAEDIVSETFVGAWARRATIRTETLKAYLFAIARNVSLQRQRKIARQVQLEESYPDPAPGPDSLMETRTTLRNVQSILDTLPEIERTAFILRVQYELPTEEIARVLGLSLSAARVKVHRTRKKLIAARTDTEVS